MDESDDLTASNADFFMAALWDAARPAGIEVPGYDILTEISRGGMGAVYHARQHRPEREVALKVLLPQFAEEPEMLARFQLEARAMAALDHPGILPVYEVGEADGMPFFSMKLADGGSLADRLKHGPMPARDAAELMVSLARAVHHAHQHGVLHRDLKPGNFLFMEDGRACVSDFGLAKLSVQDQSPLTRTESFFGTPHYMPPEVAAGSVADSTVAGDLYAMGAVFYECLTGRRPHESRENVAALLRSIADDPIKPPLEILQTVPRDLSVICMKALERNPQDRYATLEEFAADIERWLKGMPILARPAGPLETAWRWARRHPLPASLLGALLLVTVTGGTLLVLSHMEQRRKLHRLLVEQARSERLLGSPGHLERGRSLLRQAAAMESTREIRDEAAALLVRTDLETEAAAKVSPPPPEDDDDPALAVVPSPDGSSWLTSHESGSVRWWKDGKTRRVWHPAAERVVTASFVSNGSKVLAAETETGWVLASANCETMLMPADPDGCEVLALAMDPQESRIAVSRVDGLQVIALRERERGWKHGESPPRCAPAWSGDGSRLAVAMGDRREVLVLSAEDGTVCSTIPTSGMPEQLALDDGGFLLAAACDDGMMTLHDAADGARLTTIPLRSCGLWIADGSLGSVSKERVVSRWKLAGGTAFERWREPPRPKTDGRVRGIALSPDGQRLLTVSAGCVAIWSVAERRQTGVWMLENQRVDAEAAAWWIGVSEILVQVPGGLERVSVSPEGEPGEPSQVKRPPGSRVIDLMEDGTWLMSVTDDQGNETFQGWPDGDSTKAIAMDRDGEEPSDRVRLIDGATLETTAPDGSTMRLIGPNLPDFAGACRSGNPARVIAVTKDHRVFSWNLDELARVISREGF